MRNIAIFLIFMMNSIAMMSAERDIKVAGTTLAYMASAMDVLDQQAGVDLLDNYIIIDGKYRAAVYVDDKLVSNISQLQRMSTSLIDRISIIINPDAEYDKGIYALIKITMLKAEGKKIKAESQLKLDLTHTAAWNFDQYLSWQKSNIAVEASFSYKDENCRRDAIVYQQNYTPKSSGDGLRLNQRATIDLGQEVANRSIGFTTGLDWFVTKDHKLSVRYEFSSLPKSHNHNNAPNRVAKIFFADEDGKVDPSKPNSMAKQSEWFFWPDTKHEWNFAYSGKVNKWQLTGDVKLTYEEPKASVGVEQDGKNLYDLYYNRHSLTEVSRFTAKYSTDNTNIVIGVADNYDWMNLRYFNLATTDDKIHAHQYEHTAAAFASIERKLNRWTIAGGLRYEYTHQKYEAQDDDEALAYLKEKGINQLVVTRNHNRLHPNASVTYSAPNSSLSLAYSQNIKSPNLSYSRIDRTFAEKGDEGILQAEWQHTTTLTYKYRKWLQANIAHNYIWHPIYYTIYTFYYYNGDNYHDLDATLILSPKISIWQPTLTMSLHKQWNNMPTANGVNKLSSPLLNASWNNILNLPKKWTVYVNASYRSRGAMRNIRMHSTNFTMDASIRKALLKDRLQLTLSTTNILRTDCNDISLYAHAEKQTSDGVKIYMPRTVSFTAIYSFGK